MTPHETFDTCMDALASALGLTLPDRAENDPVILSIDGTEVTLREDAAGHQIQHPGLLGIGQYKSAQTIGG